MKGYFLSLIQGEKKDPLSQSLKFFLWLLSLVYGASVSLIRFLYESGWLRQERLPVPAISVGNLTWGGTGKTPFVIDLAKRIQLFGRKPLVLSRGYGADEWKELSFNLQHIRIGVGKDRVRIAKSLLSQEKADVVICDDAFQHWRLNRDWNIVTMNAALPFGNGFLIPRGNLRENASALKGAHTIVLTNVDRVPPNNLTQLKRKLLDHAPQAEWVETVHEPIHFYKASSKEIRALGSFRGVSTVAVSAIGSPELFSATLRDIGMNIKKSFEFPDHHFFKEKDLLPVKEFVNEASIQDVVTTEKDFFRVPELWIHMLDPWILKVRIKIISGEEKITARLLALLKLLSKETVYA